MLPLLLALCLISVANGVKIFSPATGAQFAFTHTIPIVYNATCNATNALLFFQMMHMRPVVYANLTNNGTLEIPANILWPQERTVVGLRIGCMTYESGGVDSVDVELMSLEDYNALFAVAYSWWWLWIVVGAGLGLSALGFCCILCSKPKHYRPLAQRHAQQQQQQRTAPPPSNDDEPPPPSDKAIAQASASPAAVAAVMAAPAQRPTVSAASTQKSSAASTVKAVGPAASSTVKTKAKKEEPKKEEPKKEEPKKEEAKKEEPKKEEAKKEEAKKEEPAAAAAAAAAPKEDKSSLSGFDPANLVTVLHGRAIDDAIVDAIEKKNMTGAQFAKLTAADVEALGVGTPAQRAELLAFRDELLQE